MLVLFVVHHFLTDPIHVWHRPLLQQLPFAHYIEIYKNDCLRPVHLLMHGLLDVAPHIAWMGT
jgi:hypothetical protein